MYSFGKFMATIIELFLFLLYFFTIDNKIYYIYFLISINIFFLLNKKIKYKYL